MTMVMLLILTTAVIAQVSSFALGDSSSQTQSFTGNYRASFIPSSPHPNPTRPTHHHASHRRHIHESSRLFSSGGFGGVSSKSSGKNKNKKGSPSSSSTSKKMSPREAERAKKQLIAQYGGDINAGTQERIQSSLESLEPHIREAAELYKDVIKFDAMIAPMTTSDRNRLIPPIQFEMNEADRSKLKTLMEEHNLLERDLHNIYQRITWDASADAKAIGADIVGNRMKPELQERITKACSIAVDATNADGAKGKVLDVGCGHGAIVRSLADAGLSEPDMYVGIDLSSEMVKNAVERYGAARNGRTGKGRVFVVDDFCDHDFSVYRDETESEDDSSEAGVFDSVIFCSALHDLPDMEAAIAKASSLLRADGGKLVVVHAQGAMHVIGQHQANPVMVSRGLPTTKEWGDMLTDHPEWGLRLDQEPADPRSDRDLSEGYLAVLSKM